MWKFIYVYTNIYIFALMCHFLCGNLYMYIYIHIYSPCGVTFIYIRPMVSLSIYIYVGMYLCKYIYIYIRPVVSHSGDFQICVGVMERVLTAEASLWCYSRWDCIIRPVVSLSVDFQIYAGVRGLVLTAKTARWSIFGHIFGVPPRVTAGRTYIYIQSHLEGWC